MEKIKLYLKLFFNSLLLSSFTFGGGYVIISMLRKKYVEKYHMLSDEEMLDITTIAQSTPGPIAVNTSLMLGYKLAGVIGAFMCVLGIIIPPVVIISVVYLIYDLINESALVMAILSGMNAGISAIICDVILSMIKVVKREKNYIAIVTLPIVFCLAFFLNVNVYFLMLPCIVLGLVTAFYEKFKADNNLKNMQEVFAKIKENGKKKKQKKYEKPSENRDKTLICEENDSETIIKNIENEEDNK